MGVGGGGEVAPEEEEEGGDGGGSGRTEGTQSAAMDINTNTAAPAGLPHLGQAGRADGNPLMSWGFAGGSCTRPSTCLVGLPLRLPVGEGGWVRLERA